MKKKILFICGSMNQTTQMVQIAGHLQDCEAVFTPFYADGLLGMAARSGMLEFSIMGRKRSALAADYLREAGLQIDPEGSRCDYDLVVTCTDLVVPSNIRGRKTVLVQEGMTEPETPLFHLVRRVRWMPRWLAGTSTTGLSDAYDRFCVASEGYRELFVAKGVRPGKIVVTSLPNFDDCARFLENDFEHRDYILVCTSDNRETFIPENRRKNIRRWLDIADGRQLVFRLHPNERAERAEREIRRYAPGSLVYAEGKTEEMIANARMMIAGFSSTILVASALGKEVVCGISPETLKRLTPVQNRSAAKNIAGVCRELLDG